MQVAFGLALAALASLAINAGVLVQHAALAAAPDVRATRPLATLRALLASRRWRTGAALGYAGLGLEVAGLALAPVSLVQSVVAAGLVVVALGAGRHTPPARNERLAVALIVAALGALAIGPPAPHGELPPAWLLAVFLAATGGVGAVLARARGPAALGLAAGVLYGATTVAIGAWLATARAGAPGGGAALIALAGGAAVTAGGFFAFQRGLQTGHALPVVTLMTAATNVVAIAGGLSLLGERVGETAAQRALHLAAFAVVPVAAALAAPGLLRAHDAT